MLTPTHPHTYTYKHEYKIINILWDSKWQCHVMSCMCVCASFFIDASCIEHQIVFIYKIFILLKCTHIHQCSRSRGSDYSDFGPGFRQMPETKFRIKYLDKKNYSKKIRGKIQKIEVRKFDISRIGSLEF